MAGFRLLDLVEPQCSALISGALLHQRHPAADCDEFVVLGRHGGHKVTTPEFGRERLSLQLELSRAVIHQGGRYYRA